MIMIGVAAGAVVLIGAAAMIAIYTAGRYMDADIR